ncbi:sensor histidine kinase [Bailinhaonella thermotolerans]|uniref:histidine kinase n=1 Tax=Bailinhaonella thermotolerans TaxID=1070861 RepID=A0A3A4B5A5_9ACTN|nr:HAMP domain-containing sensor histidine kinase [Bailinhaonella thermotolerans]RJL33517.1 sensor histidine kinase [Bailinhaonella thermotolerans]
MSGRTARQGSTRTPETPDPNPAPAVRHEPAPGFAISPSFARPAPRRSTAGAGRGHDADGIGSEAQRRFVANASHELRTPLTLQRAMAEVALADPDASAGSLRAVLTRLLASGRHQERLIEALLTLARGHQGVRHPEPVDLAELAARSLARVPEPGPRVRSDLRPAPVYGDAALLDRLVANLLDNAVHHNVPGGWIEITTRADQAGAILTVANGGPLIPPDRVSALLQPFQRLDPARRASGDRLGLGLSIVQAIAQAHHAALRPRPLPQGGLQVTIAFPPAPPS